jgi:MarR family
VTLQTTFIRLCRTCNPANALQVAGNQITSTLAAISAAGLVLASAGFGAVWAWTAGSQHGLAMASLMVVMAVALELAKPLSVSATFTEFRRLAVVRGSALALLAVVAIVYSLSAELSLMAGARTDLIAQRTADAKTAKSVDGQRDRIEAELAMLANVRPAATVKAEIDGLMLDPRVGGCSSVDGPRSRAVCPRVATLRADLGNAERRERLEADLAGLLSTGPATATDKPADAGAHALVVYLSALGFVLPERLLSDWLVLISVLALEGGAALAMVLVQSVSGHQTPPVVEQITERQAETRPERPQSAPTPAKPGQTEPEPDPTPPRKRTPKPTAKRTQRNAKRRLGSVVRLVTANGGKVTGSQKALAKRLGVSKTRVHELLRRLEAAGVVRLRTSRTGTTVALAA